MDFKTHLPTTKNGYDAIFVVLDRITKYVHFIRTISAIKALDTAKFFIANIKLYVIPKSIISDRDPSFTSAFWKTLFKLLGTDIRMSTSYHPQSTGQREQTNRTLEQKIEQQLDICYKNMIVIWPHCNSLIIIQYQHRQDF